MNLLGHRRGVLLAVAVLVAIAVLWAALSGRDPDRAERLAERDPGSGPIELVDLGNRDFDGSPALMLTFTQPLNARQDYGKFIQVFEMPSRARKNARNRDRKKSRDGNKENSAPARGSARTDARPTDVDGADGTLVKGAWVVGENPRLLFFPHIKPETGYVVRVAPGIPAGNGQTLHAESRYEIWTDAVSPAYYFASRGTVLPARQNGGLPVVTVNVPEVDVQFLRVRPEQIPRFMAQVIGGGDSDDEDHYYDNRRLKGKVDYWELDKYHPLTESVYAGRFLTEQKANRRGVTFIPVEKIRELAEPGIYIAVMSQPNRFRYGYQVTYFYTSNLGLHTRLFEKGADAYVSALDKGGAIAGVEVSWLDQHGKILAQEKTDKDGRAHFAERPNGARVIMARQDRQVSLIALREPALDLSEYDIGGFPGRAVSLFAYSGRNLYRPGEHFDVSVLARDADGRPIEAQPIQAILKAPDGKAQFTAMWQASDVFSGYYQHKLEIPDDARTGFWNLELRADPADKRPGVTYRFGVEEFLPERMKLDLHTASAQLDAQHPFTLQVTGNYLYGAPAAGNRLLGVAQFSRNKNPLARELPGFEFGDVNEDAARQRKELDETTLDEDGKTSLDIALADAANRHSPFLVRATISLLESGGRPVVRSLERTYWPAPHLLAVRPLFSGDYAQEGSLTDFEVVRVDAGGKFSSGAFPVRLFRENREYYWRFEDQRGWHSGYTETDELVASSTVTLTESARGKVSVPVKFGRYRLEINDPETGKHLVYRFYAGWSARSDEAQGIRPDRVKLALDKPAYREGESARLTITPPHAGEALITVEGDKTLWVRRLSMPAKGATVDIALDAAWRRHDLYVSVLVLRPGADGGVKVTPARALGLLHLPLERGERKLQVELEAPRKILPDTSLKVKVKAPGAKGEKAQVTLSAVDAGILNITNFSTPDPFGHFFGKLRYGADQYDVYGRLIEKMDGQKGKLKFGGDATAARPDNLPKKVRLIDLFSGPVALDAEGEAEIALPVPDFNGQLRLMAVVAAPSHFGNAEANVVVAAPLVAEISTPRFLTIGDSAVVALDLHNLSGAEQQLDVELSNDGGLGIGEAKRKVNLKDQQKTTLRFPVTSGGAFGLVSIALKVSGSVDLKRQFTLQVQAATPRQQVLRRYSLSPGESLEIRDAELSGFLPGTAAGHLTISDTPPLDVKSAVRGLLTYPYGCAEQTTSTAYPHLFIDEAEARVFDLNPFTREARAQILEKAVARLGAMQAPNGGFSLWGNASNYEYWLSAYVSNFLLDAREQGFTVPGQMRQRAMDFLLKNLQEGAAELPKGKVAYNESSIWHDYRYGGNGRFGALAYGAYVLARESRAPLSTLRGLYESRELAHSGLARVHLGLALHLMGDEKRARTALAEGVAQPRRFNKYWWGDYGSDLRDAALSYMLLERHKLDIPGKENLIELAASELDARGRYDYTSTQEKLAIFLAGRQMVMDAAADAPWTLDLAGKSDKRTLTHAAALVQGLNAAELADGIEARNSGDRKLYLELALEGHPARMPAARSDAVELRRRLFDAQGKPLGNRELRTGETILVMLEVIPKLSIPNALIVDHIPAGLEIENFNIVRGEAMNIVKIEDIDPAAAMQTPDIQHVEFREDRFVAALRLNHGRYRNNNQSKKLFYRAKVVTPGRFVFPPVYAEDMYRPDTYGLAEGQGTLTVTDEGRSARTGD